MFFRAENGERYPISAITKMETPYAEAGELVSGPFTKVVVHLGDDHFVSVRQMEIDPDPLRADHVIRRSRRHLPHLCRR